MVQVGHFQVCALFIPVLTRAESPVSPTAQQQVRVQGLTGLCSQGLEHLLCICLDLWPSFKLPSKETHCALYIKHSCCTTQIPITGQVTNHVYCMFGLLRAHSCTFLQKTALDQWEPSLPEKPGGLQTMTGTAIQNLVTLLQDTATLWSYSCFRAFRGIRLRLDVSWNHIFACLSLHYSCLPHSITSFFWAYSLSGLPTQNSLSWLWLEADQRYLCTSDKMLAIEGKIC